MMTKALRRAAVPLAVAALSALLVACQTMTSNDKPLPPLTLVPQVDLPRFMGDWYVIASIPTVFDKSAHDAKESYRLNADGSIATTFTFRADAFDGPAKEYHSTGFVRSPSNAVWGEQYLWPFKADYRISYLASDYSQTVVTREKRDYVWIMARTPTISDDDYQRLVAFVGTQGYDPSKVQRVPQRPGPRP